MQVGLSSRIVSPWWPFLNLLSIFHREYEGSERRIEGDLTFLFRRVCGFRYLETGLLPPEGGCQVWKECCLTKGNKDFCKCTDMVESNKKVKICFVNALAAFWPKAAAEQDFSSSYDFYFLLRHLSSHRSGGVQKWFDSYQAVQS